MAINVTGNRLTINTVLTFTVSGSVLNVEKSSLTAAEKPYRMNQYYRGSNRVPIIPATQNIPASGKISLNQFYGAAKS